MNSLWNKNITLFKQRFPALYDLLADDLASFLSTTAASGGEPRIPFQLEKARNGSPTASEGGIALHSKYNPEREAQQLVSRYDGSVYTAAVFFSCGLGYAPIAFARSFPRETLIIIEENPAYLFAAFTVLDWEAVLSYAKLIFAVKAPKESVEALLRQYKSTSLYSFTVPAQSAHCKDYINAIQDAMKHTEQKEATNTNTLEKFAHLWLRNSCRNLHYIAELDGIEKYRHLNDTLSAPLPFLVLAAGPSLATVLPHLRELQERCITVCVDTALHSCLAAGVEPDFIVLVDPQYACAMHLEFLAAPSSILIAESAVWPSVFRFSCKEIVLCSSLFPIGQYFEKQLGSKGSLGTGGSVATTAWDFARCCGAKDIYIAGMDLGFPGGQTHIRGSQFEEREHRIANRIQPAETMSVSSLMGAYPSIAKDYEGNPLLTDKKMSLFSWWFETSCARAISAGTATYTLTPQSLAIKGISVRTVQELLSSPARIQDKQAFFSAAEERSKDRARKKEEAQCPRFAEVLDSFKQQLAKLDSLAKKGEALCQKALQDRTKAQALFAELSALDSAILHSDAKNAAALIFPTERRLKELTRNLPEDPQLRSLFSSKIIYQELHKAIREYLSLLP